MLGHQHKIAAMNVFVLGTGRCGTMTFVRACEHLDNYTSGHESRARLLGGERFDYPDDHIEADNRLSWFLGELGRRHPEALYVHLLRDPEAVTASFLRRWDSTFRASIIRAFAHGVLTATADWDDPEAVCRFYVDTVTANIEAFLATKQAMTLHLEEARQQFPAFLERIGAQGDLTAAVAEWDVAHNAS